MSRQRKILSLIAVAATWTLVASGSASAADCGPVNTEVTGLGEAQMESSITCLINDERTSYGLQPVTTNSDLHQAAMSHSNEMIDESYFEHTSPAGLTFMDRIESTGYMQGARTWTVGENLVWGTGPLSTPQALVTAWMNSPHHRDNVLQGGFREIGIGSDWGSPFDPMLRPSLIATTDFGAVEPATKAKAKRKTKKSKKKRRKRLKRLQRRGYEVSIRPRSKA